jgi:hypothetical protein
MTPLGFRVEQNTNAYEIHPPKTALGRLAEAVFGAKKPVDITVSNFSGASREVKKVPRKARQGDLRDRNCKRRASS